MKRLMLLSLVASLATLALGTSAEAQTVATKPMFATIACRGNTAACVKLDLYAKMASTGAGKAAGMSKSPANATSRNPGAARMGRAAAGGTENNPAMDGGRTVLKTRSHTARAQGHGVQAARSNRLTRHGDNPTINNPNSSYRAPAQQRVHAVERVTSRTRLNAVNNRGQNVVHNREITRHRPTDF